MNQPNMSSYIEQSVSIEQSYRLYIAISSYQQDIQKKYIHDWDRQQQLDTKLREWFSVLEQVTPL